MNRLAPSSRGFAPLFIILIAVVILGGTYALYLGVSSGKIHLPGQSISVTVQPIEQPVENVATSTEQLSVFPTTSVCDTTLAYSASSTPSVPVPVAWDQAPQAIPSFSLALPSEEIPDSWGPSQYYVGDTYYRVGTVTGGKYQGGTVILGIMPEGIYHFIQQNGRLTLLIKSSDVGFNYEQSTVPDYASKLNCGKFFVDAASELSGLAFPKQFTYNGTTFVLEHDVMNIETGQEMGGPAGSTPFGYNQIVSLNSRKSSADDTPFLYYYLPQFSVAFTHPTLGTVYTDVSGSGYSVHNGFYVRAADGTFRSYREANPAFFNPQDFESTVAITWNDGTTAHGDYGPYVYGTCSAQRDMVVVTNVSKSDLIPAGKTSTGDTVYAYANPNVQALHDLYKEDYPPAFNIDNTNIPTFEEFVREKPVFFWYDPLGRLVEFQNYGLFNGGGKCKPVIYLYPTKTTPVTVRVAPVGGLTESIPEYRTGWNVVANPDGGLTDATTGIRYPYLYWEGNGPDLTPPEGFVIPREEVPSFFERTLPTLGLNEKEAEAFRQYWQPRMEDAPYYFVTFLSKESIDKVAPLSVSPAPDSVIRVFMEFKPLMAPVSITPLPIYTPTRKGFSVVEWGGSPLTH